VLVTVDFRERDDAGNEYQQPALPPRRDETYSNDQLALLSSEAGKISIWEAVGEVLIAFFLNPILAGYIRYILGKGMKTDVFDPLPDIDVLDPSGGVFDVPVQQIVAGAGIVSDDTQHYPITGWLEAFWSTPIA